MLSTEVYAIPLDTELVFIAPRQGGRGRNEKTFADIDPNRVSYGYRVDNKRYRKHANGWTGWESSMDNWVTTTERTFAIAVYMVNGNGDKVYALISPKEFVGTRSEYDTFWVAESARREAARAESARLRKIAEDKRMERAKVETNAYAQLKPIAERTSEVVRSNIVQVLGESVANLAEVRIYAQGKWENEDTDAEQYVPSIDGTVSLPYKAFERLLEKLA